MGATHTPLPQKAYSTHMSSDEQGSPGEWTFVQTLVVASQYSSLRAHPWASSGSQAAPLGDGRAQVDALPSLGCLQNAGLAQFVASLHGAPTGESATQTPPRQVAPASHSDSVWEQSPPTPTRDGPQVPAQQT